MKKTILIIMIGMVLITSAVASVNLGNGEYLITGEELMGATNEQIANFMLNTLQIKSWNINMNGVKIFYNVIHIEPTDIENEFGVFNYDYETTFTLQDFTVCMGEYNLNQCAEILITGNQITTFDLGNNETYNITSTYKQAYDEEVIQYYNAIELRDNLINLNELMELI